MGLGISSRILKKPAVAAVLLASAAALLLLASDFEPTSFRDDDAEVYSRSVDELLKERQRLAGRNLRVVGRLVAGTFEWRASACEYRFQIEARGVLLPVRYEECQAFEAFRERPGLEVVVTAEGKLSPAGGFDASLVLVRSPALPSGF